MLFLINYVTNELAKKGRNNRFTGTGHNAAWAGARKSSWSNTRAKRLRMPKVSIFKLAVANANFTTRMPVFELKSNFIAIQNFKAGNVKPSGMHWSKDF